VELVEPAARVALARAVPVDSPAVPVARVLPDSPAPRVVAEMPILTWGNKAASTVENGSEEQPAGRHEGNMSVAEADTVVLETVDPAALPVDGPTPVIELHGVEKVYRTGSLEVRALQGVSLRIDRGEYVAIMGPSGSGKSTLMHIIGCLDVPTAGHYLLAGEDVGDMDEVELAEVRNRQIGFVFQQFNLLASLNAWRNVELPLTYAGVRREERKRRAVEALDRVGLAERIGHRPGELSGGQQQRVAVARALVSDPALILADEPTGNLDSVATEDALALFDELHAQGRTIVLITHEAEVAQRARRIVRVRDGWIQSDGPSDRR
jgi:putative ABC transport system ATP-binding protein